MRPMKNRYVPLPPHRAITTLDSFLHALRRFASSYVYEIERHEGRIIMYRKQDKHWFRDLCPLAAVAHSLTKRVYDDDDFHDVGRVLGLHPKIVDQITEASDTSWTTQGTLRGKILRILREHSVRYRPEPVKPRARTLSPAARARASKLDKRQWIIVP